MEGNSYYIEPATSDIDGAKNLRKKALLMDSPEDGGFEAP